MASIKCVDSFLITACNRLPALYLFKINHTIPDNNLVLKYGISNNLRRRTRDHVRTFGPDISLYINTTVDPVFQKDAENEIRKFFKECGFDKPQHSKHRELVIVPKCAMPMIRNEYARVGAAYMAYMVEAAMVKKELEMYKRIVEEKQVIIDSIRFHSMGMGIGARL